MGSSGFCVVAVLVVPGIKEKTFILYAACLSTLLVQAFLFDTEAGTTSPNVGLDLASIEQVFVQALFATVVLFPVKYVSNSRDFFL